MKLLNTLLVAKDFAKHFLTGWTPDHVDASGRKVHGHFWSSCDRDGGEFKGTDPYSIEGAISNLEDVILTAMEAEAYKSERKASELRASVQFLKDIKLKEDEC